MTREEQRELKYQIVRLINRDKEIQDIKIASQLDISVYTVRTLRRRLMIRTSSGRRENAAFLYLDDSPHASCNDLLNYMSGEGYYRFDHIQAYYYMNKYKAVAEERQAARAEFFPERLAA